MTMTLQDIMAERLCTDELPSPSERKLLRKAGGLTLKEMASAVGVTSHQAVIQWERGATPHPRNLPAYVKVLNTIRAELNRTRTA